MCMSAAKLSEITLEPGPRGPLLATVLRQELEGGHPRLWVADVCLQIQKTLHINNSAAGPTHAGQTIPLHLLALIC